MRIPMLSTMIKSLVKVCKVLDVAAPRVRPFVPEDKLSGYDTAVEAVKAACDDGYRSCE